MGFKVFNMFKQRSEEGDSQRVRYVYASENETVTCRSELLKRFREERAEMDLSAIIDDETVVGAELVNDLEVTTLRSRPMMQCRRRRKRGGRCDACAFGAYGR